MSDPNDLAAFLNDAWQLLRRGVADSRSPARYPTFATVSPAGVPEARTVALRRASQEEAVVEAHTDIVTPKVTALRASPIAALHIWIPKSNLQIRLTTRVEILSGEGVEDAWAKVPPSSRVSYGTVPDPGTPIEHVHAYDKPPERDRFAVLRCMIDHIDLVHLGDRHRRAEYARHDNWVGNWRAP
ncbi:pyridoxamine 5'-phosphate oxidase family protein [Tateyamaria omphalii]|uniref:pyridoxamine 5'-phosphate oxidase family protein n=1 Tax=Tateyamaria omphalii TaxID=299262 RepID=UPI001C997163|nr:pyridoxamine 5'-phosphate oxidase family protein [Tateyamaria omphalii]MBY5932616.1 pyridoxamine 5'-phosphate oxidase family protein [Tateyamaria omphalii]